MVEVPYRGAEDFVVVVLVDYLDPMAGGIVLVRLVLAERALLNGFFASGRV